MCKTIEMGKNGDKSKILYYWQAIYICVCIQQKCFFNQRSAHKRGARKFSRNCHGLVKFSFANNPLENYSNCLIYIISL